MLLRRFFSTSLKTGPAIRRRAPGTVHAQKGKPISAQEAVKLINSGDKVFLHSVAATPHVLVDAMVARAPELRNVQIYQLHTEGPAKYGDPEYKDSFFVNCLFTGANLRKAVREGRAGYIPVFLSEIPSLFDRGAIPLDVALVQVSAPDKFGFCTLGTSIDISVSAVENAKLVIAQINPNMPRTHGDGFVHISNFDAVVEGPATLPTINQPKISPVHAMIGQNIANIIEDGSTLQMGIGGIPNAALACLKNHKHLGIHTEMFSDGILDLVESGVITNANKAIDRNQSVVSFVLGSNRLYEYINDNPSVHFQRIDHVNQPSVIALNPKVAAINSCIEVDLTGQVVSDSIGSSIYSGVGGQMDFIRGAALSDGGKPIIALPSLVEKTGESRISATLKQGGGVVTTRAHVHWIVTEYGAVYLRGKNLFERADLLISIAHPSHRDQLADWAMKNLNKKF